MKNEHITEQDLIFFKHEISEGLPCDAYSTHTHNKYELIYFLNGDATHVIEDRKYKLKKGDLILIRPFRYHFIQIDAPTAYERYDILFDPERHCIESVQRIPEQTEVVSLAGNAMAEDIFRRCDFYRRSCDAPTFRDILPHLLNELFYLISLAPQPCPEVSAPLSPLISQALRYTNEHLETLGGIAEIAEHLFVSESYLFRLFRKELHQTPKKYIREKRLLMAQELLAAGERPSAVCEKCGFCDYTTFYRNYTTFFGHPPSVPAHGG